MKNLTIVIHAGAQQTLADSLRSMSQVQGFIFTHVEGHSNYSEEDPFLSARDKVVGYVPRVRVDVLVEDVNIDAVLAALLSLESFQGQGAYWVNAVEQQGWL